MRATNPAAKISDQVADGFCQAEGLRLYHSFNTRWLAELGVEPRVIFDIGSYDCGDGIRFKIAFPGAEVFSFEADPTRFGTVRRHADLFAVASIRAAIGSVDGAVPWYAVRDHLIDAGGIGSQGSIYLHTPALNARCPYLEQATDPQLVPGMRLDTFCHARGIGEISVAHIDVQGAEHDVIVGLGELRPNLIYAEMPGDEAIRWIGAKDPELVGDLLTGLGYLLVGHYAGDRLYMC